MIPFSYAAGHSIYAHDDVRLAQSEEFTAVDERAQRPALSQNVWRWGTPRGVIYSAGWDWYSSWVSKAKVGYCVIRSVMNASAEVGG